MIIDDVGKVYNILKPMNQSGFYPGIQVEFRKISTENCNEMITNPLILDNI